MLFDGCFVFGGFLFTFLLGLPFVSLLPSSHFRFKYLTSSLFGYGFVGLITTVLYKFGVPQAITYRYLWALNIVVLFFVIRNRASWLASWQNQPKEVKQALLIWLGATLVIVLPYWTGGPRFYTYQGWIHDQFSYIGSSLTYSHERFAEILQSQTEFFKRVPISLYGAIDLFRRPTIDHVYGILSLVHREEMYRWGYLFLAFLDANGILACTFLIVNVFRCSLRRAATIAAAIYLGYWGQAYIDFNAWSMAGAIPLLTVLTGCILVFSRRLSEGSGITLRELLPFGCLYGFSLYIYPEDSAFHVPAFLALLFITCMAKDFRSLKPRPILKSASLILGALIGGFALTAGYFQGTMKYFVWAVKFADSNIITQAVWATYMEAIFGQGQWFRPVIAQAVSYSVSVVHVEKNSYILRYLFARMFLHGDIGLLFAFIVDGFYGLIGNYFLTPLARWPIYGQNLWRLVLTIGPILLLRQSWTTFGATSTTIRKLFLMTGLLTGILLFMLAGGRIFGTARGLYYIAPYLLILLFTPLLMAKNVRQVRYVPLILILVSQVAFGFARIGFATTRGPHYKLPYSLANTHYFVEGKANFDWDLGRFDSEIGKCHSVYIDVPNGWQEYMVTFYLYSKGKKFVKTIPVKTSYWDPAGLGKMPLDGTEDCVMGVQPKLTADGSTFNELKLSPFKPTPEMLAGGKIIPPKK